MKPNTFYGKNKEIYCDAQLRLWCVRIVDRMSDNILATPTNEVPPDANDSHETAKRFDDIARILDYWPSHEQIKWTEMTSRVCWYDAREVTWVDGHRIVLEQDGQVLHGPTTNDENWGVLQRINDVLETSEFDVTVSYEAVQKTRIEPLIDKPRDDTNKVWVPRIVEVIEPRPAFI